MVSILNLLSTATDTASAAAHMFTTACSGEEFSMKGASQWGYIPDMLQTHGLCSYREWAEYKLAMQTCGQAQPADENGNTHYLVDKDCLVYLLNPPSNGPSYPFYKWWNTTDTLPYRLRVLPHNCDRDYERFTLGDKEMKACMPAQGQAHLVSPDGSSTSTIERDEIVSTHTRTQPRNELTNAPFVIAKMPTDADNTYGFTSVENVSKTNPPSFVTCAQIHQASRIDSQ